VATNKKTKSQKRSRPARQQAKARVIPTFDFGPEAPATQPKGSEKEARRWYNRFLKSPSPETVAQREAQLKQAQEEIAVLRERLVLKALSSGSKITACIGVFYREEFHIIGSKSVKLTDTVFEWEGRTYNIDPAAVSFFWKQPYMLYEREHANPLVFKRGVVEGQLSLTLQRYFKDHIIREVAKNQPVTKVGWDKWTVVLMLALGMFGAFMGGALLAPILFGSAAGRI